MPFGVAPRASQHFVEDNACRPQVRLFCSLSVPRFWCHVCRRACNTLGCDARHQQSGQTEIRNPGRISLNQDISWLQVAVNDSSPMQMRKARENARDHDHRCVDRWSTSSMQLEPVSERTIRGEFTDDDDLAIIHFCLDYGQDVGVPGRLHPYAGLALNLIEVGILKDGKLERDLGCSQCGTSFCQPDNAESSLAKLSQERIGSNLVIGTKHDVVHS